LRSLWRWYPIARQSRKDTLRNLKLGQLPLQFFDASQECGYAVLYLFAARRDQV
jgi:hypothetical protein